MEKINNYSTTERIIDGVGRFLSTFDFEVLLTITIWLIILIARIFLPNNHHNNYTERFVDDFVRFSLIFTLMLIMIPILIYVLL